MKRRDLLKGGLLAGIAGWFSISTSKKYFKYSFIPKKEIFVPPRQVEKVYLDGEDVTDRCYYCNEQEGIVHLYKQSVDFPKSFYMEYIGDKTLMKKDSYKQYAWIDYEGKKTFVEINPAELAREIRHGEVVIILKEMI